jgi:predicted nucleic acid-binding protein
VSFVLDSSVALSWCFEDEQTPTRLALLERVAEAGALAPQLWPLEVLNGLIMAERRNRLDATRRRQLAAAMQQLPISLDARTSAQAWTASAGLAERFRLTVYDAAYLELAERSGCALATLDKDLRAAAHAIHVSVLEG